MKTKDVIEALIYRHPDFRSVLQIMNVIGIERKISSSEHPELNNVLKNFNNCSVVSTISSIQTIFIVDTSAGTVKHPVIKIEGWNSEILSISKTGISAALNAGINIRDFLPQPFHRKVIYIPDFNLSKGIVFSEYTKNVWTTGDPMVIPAENKLKAGAREIIDNVVLDLVAQDE